MKIKTLFLLPRLMITLLVLLIPLSIQSQTFPNPGIDISPLIGISSAITSHLSDLDGDGDLDVIDSFSGQFGWYENLDGLGTYGPNQNIVQTSYYSHDIETADLDGDGDMDLISIGQGLSSIYWYKNLDGLGTFGPPQTIITPEYGTNSLFPADLDGDGDMDLLSASFLNNRIAWYENTDGFGTFGVQQIIFTAPYFMLDVFAADLDGDGDMDVLSASRDDDQIAWYENDGMGTFGSQQSITTLADEAAIVYAVDIDGDGDNDVLSGSLGDDRIAWYENDGLGVFGAQQNIPLASGFDLRDIFPADIDGDGDIDVVSASHGSSNSLVAWHENTDCLGTFDPQETISDTVWTWGARVVSAGDIDLDGDMDVLVSHEAGSHVSWHENTTPIVSQTNLPVIVYICDENFEEFCGPVSTICNNYIYNWYYNEPINQAPNPVTNSNPNDQCYTPDQYGSYTLVIEDNNGNFTTHNILVLEEIPQPIIGLGGEICEGEVISIAGQGFDYGTYQITWFHNANIVQQGGTTLIGQFTTGTISVEIFHVVCNTSVSTSVTIKDCCLDTIPQPVLGSGGKICIGDIISLMGQGFDNSAFEITWFHNGNIVQQGGVTLTTSFASGTITVEVLSLECDEILFTSVTIKDCCLDTIPQPILGSGGKICVGDIISVVGQGFDNGLYNITWFHNGNAVQQGGTTLTTSFTSGIVTVQIAPIDCKETLSASVAIKQCYSDDKPLLLEYTWQEKEEKTRNNNLNDLGLNNEVITLFPNPSSGVINLKTNFDADKYQISDLHGRTINFGILKSSNTVINLSSLESGVYLLQIQSRTGESHIKTVIKD